MRNCGKNIGIDIDINTREKYRYFSHQSCGVFLYSTQSFFLNARCIIQGGKMQVRLKLLRYTNIHTRAPNQRYRSVENVSTKRSKWLQQWVKRACWWKQVLLRSKNTIRYSMEEQVFMLTHICSFASARLLRMNFRTVGNHQTALSRSSFKNFLILVVFSITQERAFVLLWWPLIITVSAIALVMLFAY